jgi:hypothetical protein
MLQHLCCSPGPCKTWHKVSSTSWDGLKDNAFWQRWLWTDPNSQDAKDAKLREMDFWVGD